MLFLTLPAKSVSELQQYVQTYEEQVDGFEIRWDEGLDFKKASIIRTFTTKPLIYTYRTQAQGGLGQHIDFDGLCQLAKGLPDYLDFEYHWPKEWFANFKKQFPNIETIVSYHDFEKVPKNWPQMPAGDIIKIAGFCRDVKDALHLLKFLKRSSIPMIVVGMGAHGQWTRIAAKSFGSLLTYTCLPNMPMAPGQMDVQTMNEIYRYREISSHTKYYALLGNPIEHSIGHIYHNEAFQEKHIDARYLKIKLDEHLLPYFLDKIKNWAFQGFSVTMPLKIKVRDYCETNHYWPSINTLYLKNKQWYGENTDAPGAWEVLKDIYFESVLILGAGGAGQSIAQILKDKRVSVYCYNIRVKEGIEVFSNIEDISKVDVIINTIPSLSKDLIAYLPSLKPSMIMDIVYPSPDLEKLADQHQIPFINGHKLFYQQAILQQNIWRQNLIL